MHLSDETPLTVRPRRTRGSPGPAEAVPWRTFRLGVIPRVGALVPSGAQLVLPTIEVRPGEVCLVTMGPPGHLAPDERLPFEIGWRRDGSGDGSHRVLLKASLGDVKPEEPWLEYRFPLDAASGTSGAIVIENTGTWRFWRRNPELVLYDLVVSDEATLDLERARSFRNLRIRNETANFDAYYRHEAFQSAQEFASTQQGTTASTPSARTPSRAAAAESIPVQQQALPPARVPTALEYSHAELLRRVALAPPLFGWALKTKVAALRSGRAPDDPSKIRVLSLCSGAGRIEYDLVRNLSPDAVSLTLLDVNRNLLDIAKGRLAAWGSVETVLGDINELDLRGQRYDVILCVSALHHVVELESVIRNIADAIGDTGEFWSIGETLGRNGGRMLPEPYQVASEYFNALPERYRYNRNTNAVDRYLPDIDCSIGCFEGIRAESIEPTLLRFLSPVQVSKHNCIVWKLFSPAYSDNFDMGSDEDRRRVDAAVDLDVTLHRRGSCGVELHGIYRRRPWNTQHAAEAEISVAGPSPVRSASSRRH